MKVPSTPPPPHRKGSVASIQALLKARKFFVRHLAGRHDEFTVRTACHVASDRHIVGLIGEDHSRRAGRFALRRLHYAAEYDWIGSAAAGHPMTPELIDIAKLGSCNSGGVGRKRPEFNCVRPIVEPDIVDLIEREARPLDRRVQPDELLQFHLQFVEIPLALLAEPVQGVPKDADFGFRQMLNSDARDVLEAK